MQQQNIYSTWDSITQVCEKIGGMRIHRRGLCRFGEVKTTILYLKHCAVKYLPYNV